MQFYLYAPDGLQGWEHSFEDKLASLEGMFGEDFWKTACIGFVDLGNETVRKALSLLTAVMWLRNPLQLEFVRYLHRGKSSTLSRADLRYLKRSK